VVVLLPLIPVDKIDESKSPFVAALLNQNITFAAKVINIVLIIAILSTMLAAVFGLARMLKSLVEDHFAPKFLRDEGNTPYKGIIFSGVVMFIFFSISFFLPKNVYLFLVSSSSFSLLFTYLMIVLSHYKYRKKMGTCRKNCQVPIFPFSSWFTIISLILIIVSMPFVKGQGVGLLAGGGLVAIFTLIYLIFYKNKTNDQEDHPVI
jgi:AAT family amino acid transporter